jgi:hypothetical protein
MRLVVYGKNIIITYLCPIRAAKLLPLQATMDAVQLKLDSILTGRAC